MIDWIIAKYLHYVLSKHGVQLIKAESEDDLLAADTFRQENYRQYLGILPMPQTPELVHPPGLFACWCLKKENNIVGTVSLFDPTLITPFAAYFFEDSPLEFKADKTFELTRLALDKSHQRIDNLYFLLLLFACYQETIKQGRNQWLVCTHIRIMNQKLRLGGFTHVLADKPKLSRQNCFQARYWSNNELDERTVKGYRAYLIDCRKGTTVKVLKKYIRRKIKNRR
ncbi:MAG: hypothetical protein GC180_12865 [Bacteroidetes bacterium]|nr:hypothetical protein [Bacteroidota bacterium]